MRKPTWLGQATRNRKRLLGQMPVWFGYLALGVASATLAFLVCVAIAGNESKVSSREINPSASRTAPEDGVANNSEAVYVHDKLMQVGVVDAGSPVLRLVDCRHYPSVVTIQRST
jgi:hypothetical protein